LYKEATAGTPGTATGLWRGVGTIEDTRETVFPEEDIGYISGVDRSYTPQLGAALTMDATPATFEQLPYLLSAGIANTTSGSADGAGSGKIYLYTLPTTTSPTLQTYTIEGGDNQEAERMEYAFVQMFQLEGKQGQAITMQADWVGRQVTLNAFSTQPATPTVEEMLMGKAKLYIDAVSATYGNTQKSNTLMAVTYKHATGWQPIMPTGDGNLYYPSIKLVAPEVTLEITFEHESTAAAEKAAWRAGTARLIRLLVQGTALTTAGTTYTHKTLIVDLPGKWESFNKLDEDNGNDIVTGLFRSRYNATVGDAGKVVVVNEVASLP
jgi:hypothetical protein